MLQAELHAKRHLILKALAVLWKKKMERDKCTDQEARKAAYFWLAGKVGLEMHQCQVTSFTEEQIRIALDALDPYMKYVEPQGGLQV